MDFCLLGLSSLSLCFRFEGLDQLLFSTSWFRWSRNLVRDHNPSFILMGLRDI
jgi:hypothetical protein